MKLDIFFMGPMANHINTLHSSPVGQLTEILVVFVYFRSTTKNKIFSSSDPKGHVMYCHHLTPVVICKLLHFNLLLCSVTTRPIGTKLGRKIHWMVH